MIKSFCHICNKPIEYNLSHIKKFCSIVCRSKGYNMSKKARDAARERRIYMNKKFPISSKQAKMNGSKSKGKIPIGENHCRWNGGKKINQEGYRCIRYKEHPRAQNGYVLEHTLAMEAYLGRFLNSDEVVHHIEGNKLNNSINN